MQEIKDIFTAIGKPNVDENMQNLLSDGVIDSMDIMVLVVEIEKRYKKPLRSEFIINECFESFGAIRAMIDRAMQ